MSKRNKNDRFWRNESTGAITYAPPEVVNFLAERSGVAFVEVSQGEVMKAQRGGFVKFTGPAQIRIAEIIAGSRGAE